MRLATALVPLVVASLTACGAAPVTPPQISTAPRAQLNDSPTNYIHLNTLPGKQTAQIQGTYYTRIISYWQPRAMDSTGTLHDVAIGRPDYDKDQRNWLARMLVGKNRSFSLFANVGVEARLNYKTTIPLYSISHISDGEGESFDVNLKDIWYSPLIRVSADTRLTTEIQAKHTQEIKTGAVSAALRVAQVATEQLAPAGKLLTTLNQDQVKKEAKVWDTAIGQLFGQSVAETRGGTGLTATWSSGQMAVVSLESPNVSNGMIPSMFSGSWSFRLDDPRMSLFSANPCLLTELNTTCAKAVVGSLTPTIVLNEPVAEKTTLVASLRKLDWYTVMVNAVNTDKKNASQFCRQVVQATDDLGLNAVDAKLTLWALQRGEPLSDAVVSAIAGSRECTAIIAPFSFATSGTYQVEMTPTTAP